MEKKNNGLTVFLVTIIIVLITFMVLYMTGIISFNKANTKNNENKVNVENNNDINVENNNSKLEQNLNKEEIGDCLNCNDENYTFNIFKSANAMQDKITAILENDKRSVNFSFSKDISFSDLEVNENKFDIKINNFTKNIYDIYIYHSGNTYEDLTLFFLMEDGTVEYMPIKKAIKNNDFKSYGIIDNMDNIVDIRDMSVTNGYTGIQSAAAIKSNGDYYQLTSFMNEKTK